MGGIGLKTPNNVGPRTLGPGPRTIYLWGMKHLITALALTFSGGLASAQEQAAAPTPATASASPIAPFAAKDKLLEEIKTWRDLNLPHVIPADQTTLRFEPRLNEIQARASAAKNEKELGAPKDDFTAWKQSLLRDKYAAAKQHGLTAEAFDQFASAQTTQANFSAALRAQVAQTAVDQRFLFTQQRTSSLLNDPSRYFDGLTARTGLAASGVSAGAPSDPKDPARYAKVRAILISQGARPAVVDMAIKEAIRQNADPLLVLAVIKQESGFNTRAHSGVGARGLMQIMPDTGRGLGVRDSSLLYDAQTNLRAGIKYLKQLWNRFTDIDMTAISGINPFASHDVKSAVAAYNAGPGAVHKYSGVPPYRETQGYVKKVLGYYAQLRQSLNV